MIETKDQVDILLLDGHEPYLDIEEHEVYLPVTPEQLYDILEQGKAFHDTHYDQNILGWVIFTIAADYVNETYLIDLPDPYEWDGCTYRNADKEAVGGLLTHNRIY